MSADELNETVDDIVEKLPRCKLREKKLVLFIILPILVLSGGLAALVVSGVLEGLFGSHSEPAPAATAAQPGAFYDLPNILVNLNTGERRPSFLSLAISLELSSQSDIAHVEQVMPRIIDNFQVYLRELRLDDLQGSAGLYRLREELLRRVNNAAQPARVRNVLFREMLVQ